MLSAENVASYSDGTPGIVDIKLTTDKKKFVISGLKTGTTSLLLINKDNQPVNWTLNVFTRSPAVVEQEVSDLLEGLIGVQIRRIGPRLFLTGSVAAEADLNRIQQITSLYPAQVESIVEVGSSAADRSINIRIDFFFVQYNKSSGYKFGTNWSTTLLPTGNAQVDFINKTFSAPTAVLSYPLPTLDMASTHGWAKIVKQATVITTNGTEASFQKGEEQNFKINGNIGGSIQKVEAGVVIKVLPRFDPQSRELEVKVDADVSDFLPSAATEAPGRSTSHLVTLVKMKLGQSLVLSGIHTRDERHQVSDGLLLLSRIPFLGPLFGSKRENDEEREGVVFLVPSVIDATPHNTVDFVNSALQEYDDYKGKIEGIQSYRRDPWAAPQPVSVQAP